MSSAPFLAEPPRRLAVFRALQLGDLLCAVPALRALRTALPETDITLVGLPWAAAFVERYPHYLDGFLAFPGYPGLPEQTPDRTSWSGFLSRVQAEHFDAAIQLHGSGGITNAVVAQFGAARIAGFIPAGSENPNPAAFLPYPEHGHEIQRLLALSTHLGAPAQGEVIDLPVHQADRDELQSVPGAADLATGTYVCVHPGARAAVRRWPAARFAAVADALAARGLRVVLTGAASEADLTAAVAAAMRSPALDLAGQTSLGALAALIDDAALLVSNDTGVAHVAAGTATPSVIIACPAETPRWAPLNRTLHRVLQAPTACREYAHAGETTGRPCALGVAPEAVLAAAHDLLGSRGVTAMGA